MLKIEDLKYIYEDGTVALENINIDLHKGNKIGVIGSNGSGKSTLFLNMVGILQPKQGKVIFNNEGLKYNKKFLRKFRQNIGIVFQDPDKQIFYSNVYDDVAFALRNLGYSEEIVRQRVYMALKKTGAYEFRNKPVHFLSYGQKKRVAIAGVLAMKSDIILFDEPTAGLDPVMTESVIDIINTLSRENKKIVISSHNMNLIYEMCDYVYVLNKGRIIGEGKVEEIFTKENILKEAGLNEPWLVKLHKNLQIPLFKDEKCLYDYWRENYEHISSRSKS
ncbi:energy-coupling factor ABC transporter ATP-binding protein [Haloimpatiens sp. FM7330]|uniref:energy-coupling factor ABC transporter ATP-binding protein n=1 Tax=Haloimpatiens sp. FM7330 TaxID=3298610 RepID=UPI003633FD46